MAKLFGWLQKRREERAFALIKEHSKTTLKAVKELNLMLDGKGSAEKVKSLEREADDIRRSIIKELVKGELEPLERAELMDLARKLDKITNYTYDASKNYALVTPRGELRRLLGEMCRHVLDAATKMVACLEEMSKGNKEEAMHLTDEVERIEEKVDDIYTSTRERLLKEKISCAEVVVFNELFFSVEGIADSCEHSCDIIRVILIRGWD